MSDSGSQRRILLLGSSLALLAGFSSAWLAVSVKNAPADMSGLEIALFRSLWLSVLIAPFMLRSQPSSNRDRCWLALRGILGGSSVVCIFQAIRQANVGTALLLYNLAPLLAIPLGARLLGERMSKTQKLGIILAVLGAGVMPAFSGPWISGPALGWAIASAVTAAASMIALRQTAQRHQFATVLFAFSLASTLATFPFVESPARALLRFDTALGAVLALSFATQWCLTLAFRYIAAAQAAVLVQTNVLWGFALDFWINGVACTDTTLAGVILSTGGLMLLQTSSWVQTLGGRKISKVLAASPPTETPNCQTPDKDATKQVSACPSSPQSADR